MHTSYTIASVIISLCITSHALIPADEIKSLPGWTGQLPSRQFSGYLNFSGTKHMHYWFVFSENSPQNDPVILWLNGGPGCSSLDGFIYEHGPFRIDENDPTHKTLVKFDYSWAKVANMLYLESPVGVGFSYSDSASDYTTDDDKTAQDNLQAIQTFFANYPEFASNKFFITGESYAGIYVPTLAEAIMWATNNGTYKGPKLNGIAVGNGCSGNTIGVCGGERDKYDTMFFLGTAFMPESLKADIRSKCGDFSVISPECANLIKEYEGFMGNVDLYNIYGDCISGSEQEVMGKTVSKIPMNPRVGASGPNACINSIEASAYFNQPSVISSIHVVPPPYSWAVCANQIRYKSTRPNLPRDTYPALNKFVRVVIYNGDWDASVPYTDNEAWTTSMGYPVLSSWHPWYFHDDSLKQPTQVAGYATVYNTPYNFTFITVKGGRHEVPETAPRQAFEMIKRIIAGQSF